MKRAYASCRNYRALIRIATELQNSSYLAEAISLVTSQGGSVQFHAGEVTYASAELLLTQSEIRLNRRNQFLLHVIVMEFLIPTC